MYNCLIMAKRKIGLRQQKKIRDISKDDGRDVVASAARGPAAALPLAKSFGRPGPDVAEVRRGLAAFDAGDYRAASQAWGRVSPSAAGLAPARAEAHFRLGLAGGVNAARAVADLSQAVQLAPDRAIYHYHLGLALSRQGSARKALAAHERALELDPGTQRFRRQLALALLAGGDAGRAAALLEAGGKPGSEADLRLLALARVQQGDSDAALACLERVCGPTGYARLARATLLAAGGQLELARTLLTGVVAEADRLTSEAQRQAWLALGSVRERLGDREGAAAALRQAHALGLRGPELARACQQLAVDLVLDQRLADAVALWELALEARPEERIRKNLAHGLEVLGNEAVRREDFARAAECWKRALELEPDNDRVGRNLALAYERLERWSDANARWEDLVRKLKKELQSARRDQGQTAELRRRLVVAHRHIGENHRAAHDLDQAVRELERALNYDPTDQELRKRAAELCLENENWHGAIEHLKSLLAAQPDDLSLLRNLGAAYDMSGDERQATAVFEGILAREPGDTATRRLLASALHSRAHRLADSGQLDRAIAEMQRAISLDPSGGDHHRCLASLYLDAGDPAAARKLLDQWLAARGQNARAHLEVAGIYLVRGMTKPARQYFRRAEELSGKDPRIMALIAMAYLKTGHEAQARPYLAATQELDDVRLLLSLALALLKSDRWRAAEVVPYLEKAARLAPDDSEPHYALAQVAIEMGDYARARRELEQAEALARAAGDRETLSVLVELRQAIGMLEGNPELAADSGRRR